MHCKNCGNEVPQGDRFCIHCGKPLVSAEKEKKRLLVPICIGVSIILIVGIFALFSSFVFGLSGTYYTDEYFPVDTLTFKRDGTFTAYSWSSESYAETLTGKYRMKMDGQYQLNFTDGISKSKNPVIQYEASTEGSMYELYVKKLDENTISVTVNSKIGYYAWDGSEAKFYITDDTLDDTEWESNVEDMIAGYDDDSYEEEYENQSEEESEIINDSANEYTDIVNQLGQMDPVNIDNREKDFIRLMVSPFVNAKVCDSGETYLPEEMSDFDISSVLYRLVRQTDWKNDGNMPLDYMKYSKDEDGQIICGKAVY